MDAGHEQGTRTGRTQFGFRGHLGPLSDGDKVLDLGRAVEEGRRLHLRPVLVPCIHYRKFMNIEIV